MRILLFIAGICLISLTSVSCVAQTDAEVEGLINSLSTTDSLGRAAAFNRLEEIVEPADRALVLQRVWADADQATDGGDAVRQSLLAYLMTRADETLLDDDSVASLVAGVAASENVELRLSLLDLYQERAPSDPEDLYQFLDDPDDAIRARTLSILWRRGERERVRDYFNMYGADAERERSVRRAGLLLQAPAAQ